MPKRNGERSLTGDAQIGHHARCVGQDQWVVSFLPGRTLSKNQASAALRVAEEVNALGDYAAALGLTVLELVGLAMMDSSAERLWSLGDAAQALSRLGRAR
ncbi:hypothetical protein [Nocardia sputi]|uniref:hypothetical protein n=1 Tax=Nocardia sputi TaxID=2943705 RepID=UPI0020BF4334|nr:hypothetical protein [Nocardia sputi]